MVLKNEADKQLEIEERRSSYKIIKERGFKSCQTNIDKLAELVKPLVYSTYLEIKDFGITLSDVKYETNIIIVEFCSEIDIKSVKNFDSYFIGYVKNRLCNFKAKYFTKTNLSFKHALSLDRKVKDGSDYTFVENLASEEDEKKQIIVSEFYEKYVGETSTFLSVIEKKILRMNLSGFSFVDISEYFGMPYSHILVLFNKIIKKIKNDAIIGE